MTNERILVVDDEKGVVFSCVRILEREGFSAVGRTNSSSVPALLRQETFDLLLTDIKMPQIDGLELLKIAKEIDPHISVVLITGYGTMEDAIKAISLGAQGFIMKPFEPSDLIATIKDNLARRALISDSLRLQTLLPLLEINQILQISGGEISLVQRILEISQREIGATRIAWLNYNASDESGSQESLINVAAVSNKDRPTILPNQAVEQVLKTQKPVWVLSNGTIIDNREGYPNIVGALLPLFTKGKFAGILTAETSTSQSGPFGQISLELLSVLVGQLAIIIENVQLFQQAEALRSFNEDIIQYMTNGLIAVDQHHRITAFNPAASTMLGCEISNVLHRSISQIKARAPELVNVFQDTLTTNKIFSHKEIVIQSDAGQSRPISVSTAHLGGGADETAGVVAVLEDLSEIKALEAESRRLDRLAALGEMAAVVAHEIRNPVAGIAAGVDYLARNAPDGSPESEGAAMIQDEIKRVNRILEDILFVARPLQLNLSSHVVSNIIDKVMQRCQPQITESNIEAVLELDDNLPQLYVDGQRLEQVLSNLAINATQAMQNGGRLLLKGKVESNGADNDSIIITIADTGPGIPPDIQQKIFEPFFTTKTRGTGLGLSVARSIIEGHKGTISVESSSTGTCFTIRLPVTTRTTP